MKAILSAACVTLSLCLSGCDFTAPTSEPPDSTVEPVRDGFYDTLDLAPDSARGRGG